MQGDNPQIVTHYCFNPVCLDPSTRIFQTHHPHQGFMKCQKWIISQKELIQVGSTSSSFATLCNSPIDFENQPIKCLMMVKMLKNSDWKEYLQQLQEEYKKKINEMIEHQFSIISNKLDLLSNKSDIFDNLKSMTFNPQNVKEFFDINPIPSFFSSEYLDTCYQIKNQSLKKHLRLIQEQIKQLSSSFFTQRIKCQNLNINEKKALYTYITEQKKQNPFQKVQEISKALEKPQIKYKKENDYTFLECPICSIASPKMTYKKNDIKKVIAETLLDHLYHFHYDRLSEVYKFKLAKSHIKHITMKQFLGQAKHYKNVLIIDRSSGVKYEQSFETYRQDIYPIEVLNKKTIHMAKGRHILLKQNDGIERAITQLVRICNLRGQNVGVQSTKTSFINILQELPGIKLQKNIFKPIQV